MLALALSLLAAAQDPGAVLLEAAMRAQAAGHAAEAERWVRGWATLGASPRPPPELAGLAAEAESWVLEAGRFRLFASRTGDRVRVGLDDPARLVDRVEVAAVTEGGRALLKRAESEAPGRMDFILDAALPEGSILEVRATAEVGGEALVLRRFVLAEAQAAPASPSMVPPPPDPRLQRPQAQQAAAHDPVPWWWIAAGVVAAGLAGAAIVQETRF